MTNLINPPRTIPELDLGDAILRRVELQAIIEKANDEVKQINKQLIDELGIGTHEHEHAKVIIGRRGTLDAKKLETAFPAEQFPQLYEQKLSTTKVKNEFAPTALENYKTYSAPTVTIR